LLAFDIDTMNKVYVKKLLYTRLDEAEPFDALLTQCQAVQDSANAG
jgi:hypothetical protein